MAVRMFVLQSQYRMPLDFTEQAILAAKNGWSTLNEGLSFGHAYGEKLGWTGQEVTLESDAIAQFQASMDDDFNTPGAIAVLFGLAKELQRQSNLMVHSGKPDANPDRLHQQWATLVELAGVLGLEAQFADESAEIEGLSDDVIESLIAQRTAAKQAKNYAQSDRIRDELREKGITLIDKPGGVTDWHR